MLQGPGFAEMFLTSTPEKNKFNSMEYIQKG